MRVSELFVQNMKARRKSAGWSQQQLADRLGELGFEITRDALARIESNSTRGKNLSLEEALAIACALSTPLTAMMLPTGGGEGIEPVPGGTVENPWRMFEWLRCTEPLDSDDLHRWQPAVVPFWVYDDARQRQKRLGDAAQRRFSVLARIADDESLNRYDKAVSGPTDNKKLWRAQQRLIRDARPKELAGDEWESAEADYEAALVAYVDGLERMRGTGLDDNGLLPAGFEVDFRWIHERPA
jgi:transcriptional regulator with XRE-family HTH domain